MSGPAGRERRRRRALLVAALAAFLALLWVGWDSVVLHPLKLFVVFLHEGSHGLAALLTGGEIREIGVTLDEGGFCRCPGGNAFLTLSAGYLGSLAWGAVLVLAGGGGRHLTRGSLLAVGGGVLALTLLYVRSAAALLLGLGFGAGLLVAALRGSLRVRRVVLVGLGSVSCLYAVLDIKSDVLDRPGTASDAALVAEMTGVPTLLWGLLWAGVSVAVCAALVRRAWRRA